MDLYKQIMIEVLSSDEISITFPNLKLSPEQVVHSICYKALVMIRRVLDDDTLDDPDCFKRIEQIVSIYESIGSNGGSRHDFG